MPLLELSRISFSVISCEWCSECSLSRNILCCSELARRQVSHVDKVQEEIPRQARVMAARWIDCMESGRLFSARTNWKLRIPPIRPQIQHAENRIIIRPVLLRAHSTPHIPQTRKQSPLHTGDASPCCGLCSPRTQLMPTAPRTMLATPKPTSTTDSRSRLHRILRLEHILPRASLQLQQEEAAGGERGVRFSVLRLRRGSTMVSYPAGREGLSEQVGPTGAERLK